MQMEMRLKHALAFAQDRAAGSNGEGGDWGKADLSKTDDICLAVACDCLDQLCAVGPFGAILRNVRGILYNEIFTPQAAAEISQMRNMPPDWDAPVDVQKIMLRDHLYKPPVRQYCEQVTYAERSAQQQIEMNAILGGEGTSVDGVKYLVRNFDQDERAELAIYCASTLRGEHALRTGGDFLGSFGADEQIQVLCSAVTALPAKTQQRLLPMMLPACSTKLDTTAKHAALEEVVGNMPSQDRRELVVHALALAEVNDAKESEGGEEDTEEAAAAGLSRMSAQRRHSASKLQGQMLKLMASFTGGDVLATIVSMALSLSTADLEGLMDAVVAAQDDEEKERICNAAMNQVPVVLKQAMLQEWMTQMDPYLQIDPLVACAKQLGETHLQSFVYDVLKDTPTTLEQLAVAKGLMQAERHKLNDPDEGSLIGFVGLLLEAVNVDDRVKFLNGVGITLPVEEVVRYVVSLRECVLRRNDGLSIQDLSGIMAQMFKSLDQPARHPIFLHLLKVGSVDMNERMRMLEIDKFMKTELTTLLQEVTEKEERIAGYWNLPKRELILGNVLLMLPRKELHKLLVYVMREMPREAMEELVRFGAKSFIESLSGQVESKEQESKEHKKKAADLERKLEELQETAETNHTLMVKSAESSCDQMEAMITAGAGLLQGVLGGNVQSCRGLLDSPIDHNNALFLDVWTKIEECAHKVHDCSQIVARL
jgi:hypothetical protein